MKLRFIWSGLPVITLVFPLLVSSVMQAQLKPPSSNPAGPLEQRIAHTDPTKYQHLSAVHDGLRGIAGRRCTRH
jgi:hypothetical protein